MRIKKVHEKLNKVSPVDYDCGELCEQICCTYKEENPKESELVLYLLPGEELLYVDSPDYELYHFETYEDKYPSSWGDRGYIAKCVNPPKCNRSIRPMQCRTYPLRPHLDKNGKLHLIIDDSKTPYTCPLIRDHVKLNDDFIKATYEAWKELLEDSLVYDLLVLESKKRYDEKIEYETIL
ncbi:MAG: hypothetical protein E7Z80_01480 [Methanobrevibacter thaueri]|nr:hypothetical protein [Methanobrevibacter thaueri]